MGYQLLANLWSQIVTSSNKKRQLRSIMELPLYQMYYEFLRYEIFRNGLSLVQ